LRRRDFITLVGGATAVPFAVRAQQADRMRRVGVLMGYFESDPEGQARVDALRQGLTKLGWAEGRNIQFEFRWAGGDAVRARAFAKELVALAPDLLFGQGSPQVPALAQATRTIPIVFTQFADPVGGGLVLSLARPGGNVTGFAASEYAMAPKLLETLKEIAPTIAHAGVILLPDSIPQAGQYRSIEAAAPSFGVRLTQAPVRDAGDIERAIERIARQPASGLIVLTNLVTITHRDVVVAAAARHRLPAMYGGKFFVVSGGLLSYGADQIDLWRRAASYVDRILRGEKPADLPVQLPTQFELVINLKAAKSLDLTVPPSLLARADEVIE
jgi:putative ABC transport system substrate-binding protein